MSEDSMLAVVKVRPERGGMEIREVPIPSVGSGDVLIRVEATSICGTDLHIWQWVQPWSERIRVPHIIGHEFAGVVEKVGDQVTHIVPGDHVSAETHIVCGTCMQCRTGQAHVCRNVSIIGIDVPGSFAQYIAIPASNAWVNPPDMPHHIASVQEPFGNAVHTALSTSLTGQKVLVTGCGPIGLMVIGIAKVAGAAAIYATDPQPYRRELAKKMGADEVFDSSGPSYRDWIREKTGWLGVDVLLEMSGAAQAINDGLELVRNGGYVAFLGLPSEQKVGLDVSNAIVLRGITVYGVAGRKIYETWFQTRRLLDPANPRKVDVEPVITHHLPLKEFEKGFELMEKGKCGKVVLYPWKD